MNKIRNHKDCDLKSQRKRELTEILQKKKQERNKQKVAARATTIRKISGCLGRNQAINSSDREDVIGQGENVGKTIGQNESMSNPHINERTIVLVVQEISEVES